MVWLVVVSRIVKLVVGVVGLRLGTVPISFEATRLEDRMRAVATMPFLWRLGWTFYGLASLALLAFFARLVEKLPLHVARVVMALMTGGMMMEMLTAATQIALLEIGDPHAYAAVERIGWLLATFGTYMMYGTAVVVTAASLRDRWTRRIAALLSSAMLAAMLAGLAGQHGWIEASLGTVTWIWCLFAVAAARA